MRPTRMEATPKRTANEPSQGRSEKNTDLHRAEANRTETVKERERAERKPQRTEADPF